MDPSVVKATPLSFDFKSEKDQLSNYKAYRIDTIGDGNCYFHAIMNGIYKKYSEPSFDRRSFIKKIRSELSEELEKKYHLLSRGHLGEMSKSVEAFKLDNLKRELASNNAVGNEYQELVSDIFDIDIYMLELSRKDVLVMGDDELLYKKRNSVVLISTGNHYELVSTLNKEGKFDTLYAYDHPFITLIKNRMNDLRKKK